MAQLTQFQPYGLSGKIRTFVAKAAAIPTLINIVGYSENPSPALVDDVKTNLLVKNDVEIQNELYVGNISNYVKTDVTGLTMVGTARINWTKITANGVTLDDGPPTSADTVADLQTANDGNVYTANEIAANAGQNLVVDFIGVTAFNWVQILMRVKEQAGHGLTIQLEITPFNGSAWHTFDFVKDQSADQNFENHSFFVPDDSAYINSGVVKVRVVHEMAGNANDDWVIDAIALYQ